MNTEYIFAPAGVDGSDGCLGIIIRDIRTQATDGVKFFTTKDCSQQVGWIRQPKGHSIQPHTHRSTQRIILDIPETLFIIKGKLLVNFYTSEEQYVKGIIVEEGDVVILLRGGHGFECLEDLEMYEVRQGPYLSDQDKQRFTPACQDPSRTNPGYSSP